MDFELSEDQLMLARAVESFAKKESPVSRFRKLRADSVGYSLEVWRQMGELGWLGVAFPEAKGGYGGSFLDLAIIAEKLGSTLVPEPLLASVILAGQVLAEAGNESQRERWLAPMVEGRTTLALAYAEPGTRYELSCRGTTAELDASGAYRLQGEKIFVLNGHHADQLIVSALVGAEIGLFVLDRQSPGLELTPITLIDGHRGARLRLLGAMVPSDRRLMEVVDVASLLEKTLDLGAAAACAEAVGLCQAMLDMTLDYLKTREQFGVKIGSFQVLQHRAVDMFIELELLRSVSLMASIQVSSADQAERQRAVSAAKARLAPSALRIAREAIQLFGGIGVTEEADIGLYFKRAHALCALFGDEEHHVRRFAGLPSFAEG